MIDTRNRFPDGFLWGTATAAFQIEGAGALEGREPSIWDEFCARPGAILDGSDGSVAVDHYHRYEQDVALMAKLGYPAYRFSVSWSRVLRGDGTVNPEGMAFYERLVDALLARGIEPWVTLYHWDLPASLPGGWLNRDTAYRFADYAAVVYGALGDRIPTWTTLNEPWCSAFLGYGSGLHAPGRHDPAEALTAAHHLLLAHGLGVRALRAAGATRVGITLNFTPVEPADATRAEDVDVARRVDGTSNRIFVEPVLRAAYPADVVADAGPNWPVAAIHDGDLASIAAPIDVLGVNYYTTGMVRAGTPTDEPTPPPTPHVTAPDAVDVPRGLPTTAMGWEVDPDGLRALLVRLHREYTGPAGIPLVVTENGAAFADVTGADGRVDDRDRIDYLRRHLGAALAAIGEGVDLRGYLAWSFVDNFEWSYGYTKAFGVVAVDDQFRRHPKASAHWLGRAFAAGRPD